MQLPLLLFILVARFQMALATPTTADLEQSKIYEPRAIPAALPAIILTLLPNIINLLDEEESECRFVKAVVQKALPLYPDKNIIVFKDQSASTNGLRNKYCFEQELPLAFFRTKMYQVCLFEQGRFVLAGDAGCRNWGFGGCKTRIDRIVDFCLRTEATTALQSPTVTIVTTLDLPPTTVFQTPTVTIVTTPDLPPTTEIQSPTITIVTTPDLPPTTEIESPTVTVVTTVDPPPTTQVGVSLVTVTQVSTPRTGQATELTTQSSAGSESRTSIVFTSTNQANVPKITQPVLAAAAGGFAVVAFLIP